MEQPAPTSVTCTYQCETALMITITHPDRKVLLLDSSLLPPTIRILYSLVGKGEL